MDTGIRLKVDLTGLLNGVGKAQESELNRAIIDQAVETIKALTKQVEDRTTLLAELLDYTGRLESSMGWAAATRGWYKFPEAGDLGDRVKAVLGEDNGENN